MFPFSWALSQVQIELHCVFFDGEVVGLRTLLGFLYLQIAVFLRCLTLFLFMAPTFPTGNLQGFNEALALGTMVANLFMSPSFW